jgi:hypothetical protein
LFGWFSLLFLVKNTIFNEGLQEAVFHIKYGCKYSLTFEFKWNRASSYHTRITRSLRPSNSELATDSNVYSS